MQWLGRRSNRSIRWSTFPNAHITLLIRLLLVLKNSKGPSTFVCLNTDQKVWEEIENQYLIMQLLYITTKKNAGKCTGGLRGFYFFCAGYGPRVLFLLGKHFSTELYPQRTPFLSQKCGRRKCWRFPGNRIRMMNLEHVPLYLLLSQNLLTQLKRYKHVTVLVTGKGIIFC